MWRSREQHPNPERDGIYVVARFDGDRMTDWNTDYAYIKERGGWTPNTVGGYYLIFTHWMPYSDYRAAMEAVPREAVEK